MDSSKLLLDEYPLLVLPRLATIIGLNEAIVLQQVHYWLIENQKSKRTNNFREGRWWTYNTYPQWQEHNFPFWSIGTIKRTFLALEEVGILISEQLEERNWDRAKWYSVDYEKLEIIINNSGMIHSNGSKCAIRVDQVDPIIIESETTAETKTDSISVEKSTQLDAPALSAKPKPTDLEPATSGGKLLMQCLGVEAKAKGRRGPKYFKTLACRDKFLAAEIQLGPVKLEEAIKTGLEMNITSVERLVGYIAGWAKHADKPVYENGQIKTSGPQRIQARDR